MAVDPGTPPQGADRTSKAKPCLVAGLVCASLAVALAGTAYTGPGQIPGVTPPAPVVQFGLPAVRVLLDVTALSTLGLSLVPALVGDARRALVEPVLVRARRASAIAALLWMLCALLSLVLQTAELNPGGPLTTQAVVHYVAEIPAGRGQLMSAGGAFLCALLGFGALRTGEAVPAAVRAIVAALAMLPIPITGHSSSGRIHALSTMAAELHVIGAAVWAGGLAAVAVFVAPRRALLVTTVPRLSLLVTISLCVVSFSGLCNGILDVLDTPGVGLAGLVTTHFGQLVLVKVALLLALAVLGGHLRWRLMPRIVRHQRTALVAWAAVDVTVMGCAYGLGAVLARSPVV
jgi:putative copper resistance protein D